jgi:NAD(P)-dependent dehydrogenase (short-subunit alcohol dehydrogenase family)
VGKLEEKVAVVTGAGWALGPAISLALAREGADIVLVDLARPPIAALASEIRELGRQALPVACDVGEFGQVAAMVAKAIETYSRIDILVNNAQRFYLGDDECSPPLVSLEDVSEELWDGTFDTGVKAAFFCSKAIFPHMRERGGKIVNVGSDAGIRGSSRSAHCAASSEALRGLTKSAALDWGGYGITVNVISSSVRSDAWANEDAPVATERRVIDGNVTAEDAGALAVFLASAATDYVTGQTFVLGGSVVL